MKRTHEAKDGAEGEDATLLESSKRKRSEEKEEVVVQADALPSEVMWAILQWVGPADLARAHCVCRHWHNFMLWAETTSSDDETSAAQPQQLWRICYFNTWPPPLASSLHLVKNRPKKAVKWKKVSLQRLALARHDNPHACMARIEALLRDTSQRAGSLKDSVTSKECRPLARRAVFANESVHGVHHSVKKADAILTFLSHAAMLHEDFVNRKGRGLKLVLLLADHMYYEKLVSKEVVGRKYIVTRVHKGSIVFYSLVTGLPLRMTAKCWSQYSYEDNSTVEWYSLAGVPEWGKMVGNYSYEADTIIDKPQRERRAKKIVKHRAAAKDLQAFLFGPDNANYLTLPDLASELIDRVFLEDLDLIVD